MISKTIIISFIGLIILVLIIILIVHYIKKNKQSALSASPISFKNSSTWESLKNRPNGVNDTIWSAKILDSVYGVPEGTTSLQNGSVAYNARMLTGLSSLTKSKADDLCGNPCYWYGNRAEKTNLCKCDSGNHRAVNF